jgi:hypothetical protein
MHLLDPIELPIGSKTYVISKPPAIAGREILMQYPSSALPKVGDYATNEALMLKIMTYIGVRIDGRDDPLMLTTRQLVDNHVPDTETLMRLEFAFMAHGYAFFKNGSLSGILERIASQAVALIQKTLTDLSPVLQAKQGAEAQRSTN